MCAKKLSLPLTLTAFVAVNIPFATVYADDLVLQCPQQVNSALSDNTPAPKVIDQEYASFLKYLKRFELWDNKLTVSQIEQAHSIVGDDVAALDTLVRGMKITREQSDSLERASAALTKVSNKRELREALERVVAALKSDPALMESTIAATKLVDSIEHKMVTIVLSNTQRKQYVTRTNRLPQGTVRTEAKILQALERDAQKTTH